MLRKTAPESAGCLAERADKRVVLPDPLGPIKATISLGLIKKVILSSKTLPELRTLLKFQAIISIFPALEAGIKFDPSNCKE